MNSIQKIAHSMHLQTMRWSSRSENVHAPLYVCEELQKMTRLMLCLPDEQKAAEIALRVIRNNQHFFSQQHVTLVLNANLLLPQSVPDQFTVMAYSSKDFDKFAFPSKNFRNYIAELGINMAVDLDYNFNLVHTALIWSSRAKLRVGFHNAKREDFFNLLVRLNNYTADEHAFQMLLNYLFFQNK